MARRSKLKARESGSKSKQRKSSGSKSRVLRRINKRNADKRAMDALMSQTRAAAALGIGG